MSFDPLLAVYAALFVGVLVLFEGVRQLVGGKHDPDRAISRRMKMVRAGASSEEILAQLRRPRDDSEGSRFFLLRAVGINLRQAGKTISATSFIFCMFVATIVLALLLNQVTGSLTAVLTAIAFGFLAPLIILNRMAKKRIEEFISQLPDALDQMARGLKVGHPLNITIANVAKQMPDPLGSEFGIVVDQVSFGEEMINAIMELADRIEVEDVQFFAVAVGIQHGTGGNLARILMTLAKVIRDRATMRRRIKAISSEGRMTMIFMSFLSPGIFAIMNVTTPSYFGDVSDDPLFIKFMIFVAFMTTLNFIFLRRLVNFRV